MFSLETPVFLVRKDHTFLHANNLLRFSSCKGLFKWLSKVLQKYFDKLSKLFLP